MTPSTHVQSALGVATAAGRNVARGIGGGGRGAARIGQAVSTDAVRLVRSPRSGTLDPERLPWDAMDTTASFVAGAFGALVDLTLVRIPREKVWFERVYPGSPLTGALRDSKAAKAMDARYLHKYSKRALAPYDAEDPAATGGLVSGLSSRTHRLQSLGHDPVLGYLVGTADFLTGTGTYIDGEGRVWRVPWKSRQRGLVGALKGVFQHQVSDVGTPQGLPIPGFALLQLVRARSPFALPSRGWSSPRGKETVLWTDVARTMYANGYDVRHLLVMALVPTIVEAQIACYWRMTRRWRPARADSRARRAGMSAAAHGVAAAADIATTRQLFAMNPAALNLAGLTAVVIAVWRWIGAARPSS